MQDRTLESDYEVNVAFSKYVQVKWAGLTASVDRLDLRNVVPGVSAEVRITYRIGVNRIADGVWRTLAFEDGS